MQVILLERVEKLGRIGDIVTVKMGYARNFLLPQGKALRATDANKAKFEAQRAQIEADNAKRREEAENRAATMTDLSMVLIRQASNSGALYGSVSSRDIAAVLAELGHKVTRQQVVLDQPIKSLGIETVRIALHPEVSIEAKVNVARSPEEAELQEQGIDVIAEQFEQEKAELAEDQDQATEGEAEAGEGAEADAEAADTAATETAGDTKTSGEEATDA